MSVNSVYPNTNKCSTLECLLEDGKRTYQYWFASENKFTNIIKEQRNVYFFGHDCSLFVHFFFIEISCKHYNVTF